MAGDWIPMRVDLHEDPAVIAIAAATGLDEYAVVGRLHKLWSWANRHLADGYAPSVTSEWVDRYVSTPGFAAAMLAAGWLRARSGGIELPHFDRWNSQGAKRRVLTAQRMRKSRDAKSDAARVTKASPEKRREEKSNSPSESVAPGREKPARKQPDTPHHRAVASFADRWQARYAEKYVFADKDFRTIKGILAEVGGDDAKFALAAANFLAASEQFLVDARHPFALFASQFSRWLVAGGSHGSGSGGAVGRAGRAVAPAGKYDHLDGPAGAAGGGPATLPFPGGGAGGAARAG